MVKGGSGIGGCTESFHCFGATDGAQPRSFKSAQNAGRWVQDHGGTCTSSVAQIENSDGSTECSEGGV